MKMMVDRTLFHQMSRDASTARSRDEKGARSAISRANRVLPQHPKNPASVIVAFFCSPRAGAPRPDALRRTVEAEALSLLNEEKTIRSHHLLCSKG
jgi:hypothetical protein